MMHGAGKTLRNNDSVILNHQTNNIHSCDSSIVCASLNTVLKFETNIEFSLIYQWLWITVIIWAQYFHSNAEFSPGARAVAWGFGVI